VHSGWYDRKVRRVRDLSCADTRIYLDIEVRRVHCRSCGKVKRERLDFLADNPLYTKRFAWFVGRRCRQSTVKDVARELNLDWHTAKELDKQYMRIQVERAGTPGPKVIGIDEISIRKGHRYRIVVSDLIRGRPIWFGGMDRSEASMDQFYEWLGEKKAHGIRLAVMDMWKSFGNSTRKQAPQAAILFDKFHVMRHLGEALDVVRKSEYAVGRQGAALHQGAEVHPAVEPREPDAGRQESSADPAGCQQAVEHGLSAQGILRAAVELPIGRLCTPLFRQLARRAQVATAEALREIC
jgi:transposase